MLQIIAGLLIGAALGYFSCHFLEVRPLVNKIIKLRYDGYRPMDEAPPRPKTLPFEYVRED